MSEKLYLYIISVLVTVLLTLIIAMLKTIKKDIKNVIEDTDRNKIDITILREKEKNLRYLVKTIRSTVLSFFFIFFYY